MKGLPDLLDYNLKILFIGYNPGLRSAELGHHYAGKSNRFWRLLEQAGLTPRLFHPEEDRQLLSLGFGSTNIVARTTRGAAELTPGELRRGADALESLLTEYRPCIACYMGIGVYRAFSGRKGIVPGLQEPGMVRGVADYVCSSPSGLNRTPYREQLQCMIGLRLLLDKLERDM